jgi:DNA-binding NtrC family response regulator
MWAVVADRDSALRWLFARILTKEYYSVTLCRSPAELRERVPQMARPLVICDVDLERSRDGLQACLDLDKAGALGRVVLTSALALGETSEWGWPVLPKPFSLTELSRLLRPAGAFETWEPGS